MLLTKKYSTSWNQNTPKGLVIDLPSLIKKHCTAA